MSKSLVRMPLERIEGIILLIRGEKVILDADLAMLYGVTTKRLNEQVKRNRNRFPVDFIFSTHRGREIRAGRKLRPPQEVKILYHSPLCIY